MINLTGAILLMFIAIVSLSACDRETRADNKILCNPDTLEAFFSRPGGGDISFIRRVENADGICRQALKGGDA
jgi:hypothetical protein